MSSPARFPQRSMQAEKMIVNLQYKLDGTSAPTFLQGEGHSVVTAEAPTHNSTGDFTFYLNFSGVAQGVGTVSLGIVNAKAHIRFGSLGGTYPASGKAQHAQVVYDSGTDATGAGSTPTGHAKIHVQTYDLSSNIPTLADPDTYAHVPQVLELELTIACSSVVAQ